MKKNFLLSIASIIFILFLIEITLQLARYEYYPLKIKKYSDWREFHSFQDKRYTYEPELLWIKEDALIFNEENPKKLFALGDSNTEIPEGWTFYLSELLDKENFTVYNFGTAGYTSYQGLGLLKRILPFKPDVLLISFGSNDAHVVKTQDKDWKSRKHRLKLLLLLKTAEDRLKFLLTKQIGIVHRVSPEDYEKNLQKMAELAKKSNVEVIFLTRPFVYCEEEKENPDLYYWKAYGSLYNSIVKKVAEKYDVPYIDLYSEFEDKQELFIDDSHLTCQGHELAGKFIYENLNI